MPCRLKKQCLARRRSKALNPLVCPGNPPHRHQARTAAYPAGERHRVVALATRSPGRGTARSHQNENATVMLVLLLIERRQPEPRPIESRMEILSFGAKRLPSSATWRSRIFLWRGTIYRFLSGLLSKMSSGSNQVLGSCLRS